MNDPVNPTSPVSSLELWPGTTGPGFTIYTIANTSGTVLGYSVATGPNNINVTTGGQTYTWKSNRCYWFSVNGSNYFNSTFTMLSWSEADNNNTTTLNYFTSNYYKPSQAFAVYVNQTPNPVFVNTSVIVEYTLKNSAGTTMGYLNATTGSLAWYFNKGGLNAFQIAQQTHTLITFSHGNWNVSGMLYLISDNSTTP